MSLSDRRVMLVRHAQTEANVAARYMGRQDSAITPHGQLQLRWLARTVAEWEPDEAYVSPLERTRLTARAVVPAVVPMSVLDDLAEIDFGDAEGHTYVELQARSISLDYTSGGPIAPGGETGAEFDARLRRAASAIEAGASRIVVVTHGGVIRRLLTQWLNLPPEAGWRIAVPNAVAAVVALADGTGVLESLTPPPTLDGSTPGRRPWHL